MATAVTNPTYHLGTGRRKSSIARIRLCDGDGQITVNKRPLDEYFPQSWYAYKGTKTFDRKKVMSEWRKNKCLVVKHNTGYDELYLLAAGNMQVSDERMKTPSENAKKGEIKRLFASTLKSNKNSRVVLNKFISLVA